MQSKEALEKFYSKEDPWEYTTTPDDAKRKLRILDAIYKFLPPGGFYEKALDVGAGEGWITKDLPAKKLYGFELSDAAAARFPKNVERITDSSLIEPLAYDLVIATGVLYKQYNVAMIMDIIRRAAGGVVLLCNIESWEQPSGMPPEWIIYEDRFPYRRYVEHLVMYNCSMPRFRR